MSSSTGFIGCEARDVSQHPSPTVVDLEAGARPRDIICCLSLGSAPLRADSVVSRASSMDGAPVLAGQVWVIGSCLLLALLSPPLSGQVLLRCRARGTSRGDLGITRFLLGCSPSSGVWLGLSWLMKFSWHVGSSKERDGEASMLAWPECRSAQSVAENNDLDWDT